MPILLRWSNHQCTGKPINVIIYPFHIIHPSNPTPTPSDPQTIAQAKYDATPNTINKITFPAPLDTLDTTTLLLLLINLPRNNLHPLPINRILLHTAPQLLSVQATSAVHRVPARQTLRAHRPCGRVVCFRARGARGLPLRGGGEDSEAHLWQ